MNIENKIVEQPDDKIASIAREAEKFANNLARKPKSIVAILSEVRYLYPTLIGSGYIMSIRPGVNNDQELLILSAEDTINKVLFVHQCFPSWHMIVDKL